LDHLARALCCGALILMIYMLRGMDRDKAKGG
jgi:hypothetical protein